MINYVFKEITNLDELFPFLKLRYSVYRSGINARFCEENELGVDLDCFDRQARHFGLIEIKPEGKRAVGYIRVIVGETIKNNINRIKWDGQAHDSPSFEKLSAEFSLPYISSYISNPTKIEKQFRKLTNEEEGHVEVGRFICSSGIRQLRLGVKMIQSLIAIIKWELKINHACFTCSRRHLNLYQRLGFDLLDPSSRDLTKENFSEIIPILASYESLPKDLKKNMKTISEEYNDKGYLVIKRLAA